MINTIEIKNFKSASNLPLDLGRVNVFIGENGSGKSTILEALTFVGAAEADRLDEEFLELRGIRVASPKLMRSAFNPDNCVESIQITVTSHVDDPDSSIHNSDLIRHYNMTHNNETFSEWKVKKTTDIKRPDSEEINKDFERYLDLTDIFYQFSKIKESKEIFKQILNSGLNEDVKSILLDEELFKKSMKIYENKSVVIDIFNSAFEGLKKFAIFSPQIEQLKELNRESKLKPLGIYGEGLLTLLKEIVSKQPDAVKDIEEGLELIGWYDSFSINDEPESPSQALIIKDSYVNGINLELRNANEGFLYMLFYMTLFVSEDTPKFFAIDNIDAALNPKLCKALTEQLVKLSKKYDKQVFLTTQNPAVLDGIDLGDDEQRIFVVSRNKRDGSTKAKRLSMKDKPKDSNGEPIRLSEAMLRGYIPNALPKGF
ncbi:AAA family ATPase [Vibrio cholerae]|uniref:AAA family ATPase n=1 Tax=Vibrio cholerae TaxID=666 RepID=UPI002D9B9D85|nr:ATP-binding protein [Vibrio cholerae]MEB5514748.1 AAA family ATPase [Vibrio cholerae]